MAKRLGIAFGGSGAEGIACLAYIKALEEAEIKPDIVSGTGVGGVVAAMYAAGMSYQDMIDFIKEIDFPGAKRPINIGKIKDARHGILDDMGLEEYFKMVVPIKVFDRLYFPLKIVAAEFSTGDEVVFSSGDVGHAIRAGVSVPGIFSPYELDGVKYVDGSCVNPVPFDAIRDDCDILAGIGPEIDELMDINGTDSVFAAIMSAYGATKKSLSREKLKLCKVEIYENITVGGISSFDFGQYGDIISSVQEKAQRFIIGLKDILG